MEHPYSECFAFPPCNITNTCNLIYLQYIYTYIYTQIYKFTSKLPHPRSRDSPGHETFLAPSADKLTRNNDARVLKPPYLPTNPKVKGIEP